jgi:dienelactone hydrolase
MQCRLMVLACALAAVGCSEDSASSPDLAVGDASPAGSVVCTKLQLTGSSTSPGGATFTYDSTDEGTHYRLRGILLAPGGAGPFPAVVISHGKGGTPNGYSKLMATQMVSWGLVAIGVQYSHAPSDDGEPKGADGASPENILRADKARQLLTCVPSVDQQRIAAHGHSMGAFVTGGLLATYPSVFRAASHTAGGTCAAGNPCTPETLAPHIRTPYQLHHGDNDCTVAFRLGQALDTVLATANISHELHVYQYTRPMCTCPCNTDDHQLIAQDATMLGRVRAWYTSHGVLR